MSLEAGSSAVPRPPPRPTLPTARRVSLILSTTPAISAGQRLNVTEWPMRPEVASAPYRPGQGTAGITGHCVPTLCPRSAPGTGYDGGYRPLCPTTVSTISRPLKASALYTKASALYTRASAILGSVPAETPPPQYQPRHRPSFGLVHSPSTVAYARRHVHSEAFPGLPRRTGSDVTTTPPLYSQDGLLRRPRRHRNRPQGSDMPPRRHRNRPQGSDMSPLLA